MAELTPVVVVGTGWWATEHHLPALAAGDRVRLAAVWDADARRARQVAERFGVPSWYASVDELLAETEIRAAVVAASSAAHHEIVRRLLDAGAHVLVESPWPPLRRRRMTSLRMPGSGTVGSSSATPPSTPPRRSPCGTGCGMSSASC